MQRHKQFCVWYLLHMRPTGALEYYNKYHPQDSLKNYVLLVSLTSTPLKLAYPFMLTSTISILLVLFEHQASKVEESVVVSSTED